MKIMAVSRLFGTIVAIILVASLALSVVPAMLVQAQPFQTTPILTAGNDFTIGLKSDGTLIATGDNTYGQCNISAWTGIVQVAAGAIFTAGLKSDGSVVTTSAQNGGDVSSWTSTVQIAAGAGHTVGLKSNGRVVAAGDNSDGECAVTGWTGIVQVAAGNGFTVESSSPRNTEYFEIVR